MYQETTFVRFGTPLPPLEEDAVPAKKPVAVEDQIVTDENGRRRFHGAFTGGFSAGYWNTVGSQEGWTPQSFKSSRSEKAEQRQRLRPEDFMDEEDKGQFGIAPQQVQAREEFTADETAAASMRKRKFAQPGLAGGPIPGVPVLHELLTPIADKVAVRILKSMGWRPGQGVGPRQTRREKKRTRAHNKRELYLMQHYGCAPEDGLKASNTLKDSDDDSDSSDNEDDDADDTNAITFAPDDYDPFFAKIKDNRFGLGYSGLSREPVLSKGSAAIASAAAHINLFGPLEVLAKDNKTKLSISGQAFGVGALEEEDDDIYERDDMTKYDFSLEDRHKPRKKVAPYVQDRNVLEGFVADTNVERYQPHVYRVELPIGFKPRNWAVRKTRFEPLDAEKAHDLNLNADFRRFGLGRHDLNPQQRGKILGEALDDEEMPTTSLQAARAAEEVQPKRDRGKELLERISAKTNSFTRGGIITTEGEEKTAATATSESAESVAAALQQENKRLLANAVNRTKSLASIDPSSTGGFKPFLNNEEKQQRYEQFLIADLHDEQEISVFCATMQPVQMSPWDREMEKKEFIQARKIYKPLGGIMSDRFVSEAAVEPDEKVVGVAVPTPSVEAAKDSEKKKITMERTRTMWKPCALLCKRYNIAEPYGGNMLEETKPSSSRKAKLSVFDYLESSINTKANFQTPVIIPKHIEKPKAIIKDTERAEKLEFLETTVVPRAAAQDQKEVIVEPPPRSTKTIEKSLEYVPKSELEKLNVASMHKAPSEKLELFKAIFEDSDDDATIASDADQLQSQPEADLVQPPLTMPKTAAAANLLRNTSPPRGIFAALFTAAVDQTTTQAKEKPLKEEEVKPTWDKNKSIETSGRIAFKSRRERLLTALPDESIEEAYGPIIPTHLNKCNATMPESDVDRKLLRLIEMKKSSEAEEWVEKSAAAEASRSDSSDGGSDSSSETSKPKKKPKKSKSKKHKTERVRKHKKKDKRKSKKREKSSHKKSKKSSHS